MSLRARTARVLLVRHGQTDGNKQRYVGWEDPPLNEVGERQALLIANRLANEGITAIFSSPLTRAVQTAVPLARRTGIEVITDPDLREIHYGEFQGRAKAELELKLRKHYRHDRLPGGESLYDVYQRASRFLPALLHRLASEDSVAVFGHYWSTRMVLGALAGSPFDELFASGSYKPGNGTIYEICLDLNGTPPEASIRSQLYLLLESSSSGLSLFGSLQ